MMNENQLGEMEMLFLALADKTRLRLLNLMRDGEVCVCFFAEVLGESQPKISRHLAYLRNAGMVSARRSGKWMNYKIDVPANDRAAAVLRETLDWLVSQTEMQADYARLANICCIAETTPVAATANDIYEETYTNEKRGVTNGSQRAELETFLL